MINDAFGMQFVETCNTLRNGIDTLFHEWWQHATTEVKDAWVAEAMAQPGYPEFVAEAHLAERLDLDELLRMPQGSLGERYGTWLVRGGMTTALGSYFQDMLQSYEDTGVLDGMPEVMKYVMLRSTQSHDFQHVVTGYDASHEGEMALQAFCLAQIRLPYFGMWVSVVTTRMTFVDPESIAPIMDAVSDGWQHGRTAPGIQYVRWEDMLEQPLDEVRAQLGVVLSPLARRQAVDA